MKTNFCFKSELKKEEKKKVEKYIAKKAELLKKFFQKTDYPPQFNCEIDFLPKKKFFQVDFQLESSMGKLISSSTKKGILEGADDAFEDIRRQLRKQKDRLMTMRRRGGMSLKKRFSIHRSARFKLPD